VDTAAGQGTWSVPTAAAGGGREPEDDLHPRV